MRETPLRSDFQGVYNLQLSCKNGAKYCSVSENLPFLPQLAYSESAPGREPGQNREDGTLAQDWLETKYPGVAN